jgi:hypothetical protein
MLEWSQCDFNKKRTGTHYVEIVFLNPVKSAGHIVHSGESMAQNMITLFFMLRWDWYGFNKKRAGTHYA